MGLADLLIIAVNRRGSILAVAHLLGVEPRTVYGWIAGERPAAAEEERIRALLRQARERAPAAPLPLPR